MRIALVTTVVPFVQGGGRMIVDDLVPHLELAGHSVQVVRIPQSHNPDQLMAQMTGTRLLDLSWADRVVCVRPQAHVVSHDDKVLWFIHHVRPFYDLWDTPYRGFSVTPDRRALRSAVMAADATTMAEAGKIYVNSAVMQRRVRDFNDLDSEVLYPPLPHAGDFRSQSQGDYILYVSRLEEHKRQHLLVEAMQHVGTDVRLVLAGTGSGSEYPAALHAKVEKLGVGDRVTILDRWISHEEKVALYANCLAAAYIPYDEDSYGYPTLEACHSSKPMLSTTDSGGVSEIITDGQHGLLCSPSPEALAGAMDRLYADRSATADMGRAARDQIDALGITWHRVVQELTS